MSEVLSILGVVRVRAALDTAAEVVA